MLLENNRLIAEFSAQGAECVRFYDKETQREILWSGDPVYWGRHAPVLFPFIGRLQKDQYQFADKTYHLGQHGFARDQLFSVIAETGDYVEFALRDSEATKALYPFAFELRIRYTLTADSLETSYSVLNTGAETLYYAIGGHPALQTPISKQTPFDSYWFAFNEKSERTRIPLVGPYSDFTDLKQEVVGKQRIRRDLFQDDALIYETAAKETLYLGQGDSAFLAFHFSGFPFVGIWSPAAVEAPFVCFEPWVGIADTTTANGQLEAKKAIQTLAAGASQHVSYTIQILNKKKKD